MRKSLGIAVAAALASTALPFASAIAGTVTLDLTGQQSFDAEGDSNNTVLTFDIGANSHVTTIAFDNIVITTVGFSYLSEATIGFTDSGSTTGVNLTPGIGDDESGVGGPYSSGGPLDLANYGLDFSVGADGILRIEFFEGFDDNPNAADAVFNSGTITVGYEPTAAVPEPASWGMLLVGLGMVGGVMRQRAKVSRVTYA